MSTTSLPNTVVIGGANLDITGSCYARLIPGDSNPGLVKNSAGGVGRNVAENLQRLGLQCTLVSSVGKDIGRSFILESCKSIGIDTRHIIEHERLSTGTYVAINNQLGALLAAIADMAIIDTLTPELLFHHRSAIERADNIVVEANLPTSTLEWIASMANNKPIHADAVSATKSSRLANILPHLEILKVNSAEAAAIVGEQKSDSELAKRLFERGVKQVLLSRGARGTILHNKHGAIHRDAIKGNNENDTGAGDSLFSGFIAAQKLLKSPADQLEFATACATFTLSSTASVNPLLSIATIKQKFLLHLDESAWI